MHDMALPVSFRWDDELIRRVDGARGDVSRSLWVRRAVERALGDASADAKLKARREEIRVSVAGPPAREFRPYPKGGGR